MGIDRRRYLMAASAGAVDAPEYAIVILSYSRTSKSVIYSGSIDGGATWYGGLDNRANFTTTSGSLQMLPTGYAYKAISLNTESYRRCTYVYSIDILSPTDSNYIKYVDYNAATPAGYSGKFALSRDKILWEYYYNTSTENYLELVTGSFDLSEDREIYTGYQLTGSVVSYLDYEGRNDRDRVKQITISEDGQTAIAIMSQSSTANTDVIARYSEGGLTYGTWETIWMDSQSSGQKPHSVDISNDGQVCVITTSDGHYFSRTGPSNLRYTASYDIFGNRSQDYGCSVSGNGKVIYISGILSTRCSVDSGITWTEKTGTDGTYADKVVSNYRGNKILVQKSGELYGSVDYGNTFTQITFDGTHDYVADVAMNKWEKFKN